MTKFNALFKFFGLLGPLQATSLPWISRKEKTSTNFGILISIIIYILMGYSLSQNDFFNVHHLQTSNIRETLSPFLWYNCAGNSDNHFRWWRNVILCYKQPFPYKKTKLRILKIAHILRTDTVWIIIPLNWKVAWVNF